MIYETILQMKKTLGQVDKWLDKASEHAKKKAFDPNVFLSCRLAPDQFAFARQIQSTCDHAKFTAARLSGKEAPKHADDEQTIEALKARIASVVAWLGTFSAKDFEGSEKRVVSTPRWEGKVMSGADYFREHAVPNFYFHSAQAYAILRNNGVDVGKKDFLGELSLHAPS